MLAKDTLSVALDLSREDALELCGRLENHVGWMKVGMTLFYAEGPEIVAACKELGYKVFLDLKLHDIPHQVKGAARAAALAGADLLTVHALGGSEMIAAAREGVEEAQAQTGAERTKIVAVTVLTSMDEAALAEVGIRESAAQEVETLARMAVSSGADGIVCSPVEVERMREVLGEEAWIVCPGVRPQGSDAGDQKRVATPAKAIADGATLLVVGRPITQADDPVRACDGIVSEVSEVYIQRK